MKPLLLSSTSVICPKNDGEAVVIIEMASKLGLDVRVSQQPWGAALDKEPATTFESLKQNVILVEIPGIEREEELAHNHTLFIIDHHRYEYLDRSNPKSSLEQFADLVGHTLSRWEMGIALNDKGYIPALIRHGYSREEIENIRRFDLMAQGYTVDDFRALERDFNDGKDIGETLYVVETMRERVSYLSDLHFWSHARSKSLLALTLDSEGKIRKASFTGSPKVAQSLFDCLGGYVGGDPTSSMYWGIEFKHRPSRDEALAMIQAKT